MIPNSDLRPATPYVYSVSQLTRDVRSVLESGFPLLWLQGEISNLSRPASGHLYFSLKDAHAQIRCALFRQRGFSVAHSLRNGQHVHVCGKLSLYEPRGDFQLLIEQIETAGEGALRQAFAALKRQLEAEGWFAAERKRPLPRFARCVGLITSTSGAAIRDVLSVLRRRFPALPVRVYPTAVQGDQAVAGIVHALQQAGQRRDCDVLLLVRGGGSLEDLHAFNEESVARAIIASPIPVVTGIGHATDISIADLVADAHAPTPSAAAEWVSPDRLEWQTRLAQWQTRLCKAVQQCLRQQQQQVEHLNRRLEQQHPRRQLRHHAQRLDELHQRLTTAMRHYLHHRRQPLASLSRALHTLSPLQTLGRGYAIARDAQTQTILRNAADIAPDTRIEVLLAEGRLYCRVCERDSV